MALCRKVWAGHDGDGGGGVGGGGGGGGVVGLLSWVQAHIWVGS